MLGVTRGLLIPVGVVTFLVFPVLAGLGFNFAPGWARPIAAIIFYGSMLASLGAALAGTVLPLKASSRRKRLVVLSIMTGFGALVALAVVLAGGVSTRAVAARPASGVAVPANLGPVINTRHREAEPSFTADGRAMYFNGNDYDILVSHLIGTWEEGRWTSPQVIGPPISSSYFEVEPAINATGDKLYFTSNRPFARGDALPGLSLYVIALGRIN